MAGANIAAENGRKVTDRLVGFFGCIYKSVENAVGGRLGNDLVGLGIGLFPIVGNLEEGASFDAAGNVNKIAAQLIDGLRSFVINSFFDQPMSLVCPGGIARFSLPKLYVSKTAFAKQVTQARNQTSVSKFRDGGVGVKAKKVNTSLFKVGKLLLDKVDVIHGANASSDFGIRLSTTNDARGLVQKARVLLSAGLRGVPKRLEIRLVPNLIVSDSVFIVVSQGKNIVLPS